MVATGLVRGVSGVVSNDIQVSGLYEFPESRWREAVLFYLFGIWSGRQSVTYRPKISFGDTTLRLDTDRGEYYAYSLLTEFSVPFPLPAFREEEKLCVATGKQADVEVALARFVKNDRVKQLSLWLHRSRGCLILWKRSQRGQYGCTTINLPRLSSDDITQ